jgi:hypothetical protein
VAASLVIQHRGQVKLRENDALLQQQDRRLTELTAEHQRLSNRVAQADSPPAEDQTAELAKLRGQAETLQKQTSKLGMQLEQNRRGQPSPSASKPDPHPPEYYEQMHQMAGGAEKDARKLVRAFLTYASDNQDRFPSSLDELAPVMRKEHLSLTGTNELEIVYRGSLGELKNVPLGAVAVVRVRQTWLAPSGKMARVYGMANGSTLIVESDDNFQSWEAEHILPPPAAGP